eukprot:32273_4
MMNQGPPSPTSRSQRWLQSRWSPWQKALLQLRSKNKTQRLREARCWLRKARLVLEIGQDAEPLEEAVADVVEQEAVQGASETVEEAAAAVV